MQATALMLAGGLLALLPAGLPAAADTATPTVIGGERLGTSEVVVDAPGAAALPDLDASAWLLADLDTGEVLAAKDPHGRFRPASTQKILTALTLLPRLEPDAVHTATNDDAAVDGSKAGLVPEASYTVHQMFQALMLVSGNDAASALARAAGGAQSTVAAMNTTARDLGALDTTVRNPSGLDAPGQLTSAYDLAVLTRAAMGREDFRAYAATVKAAFPGKMPRPGKVRKTFEIFTQDRLLLNYPGAIGVKTGFTTKARGTFVGAATRGGRTLVATVLRTERDSWREAGSLLTWGFRAGATAKPVGSLDARPSAGTAGSGLVTAGNGAATGIGTGAVATRPQGDGPPGWLVTPLMIAGALTALVALLRARVLLRRRRRRLHNRRPGQRLRADRRVTRSARPAPTAAPTTAPRSVRPRPADLPPVAERPSSAPTGTGW